MSANRKNLIKSSAEYSRSYRNMRGVDLSGSEKSRGSRYAVLENMYRDYDSGDGSVIESIPGFRRIYKSSSEINGLFIEEVEGGERRVIVHDGRRLYRVNPKDNVSTPIGENTLLRNAKSSIFRYGEALCLSDGEGLYEIRQDELVPIMEGEAGEPYIPTVYKNGEPCEERNLLTSRFCEKFELTRPSDYALGTESLKYRIIDERGLLASVSGICDDAAEVYIPSKVRLLGKTYTVTEIDSSAFAGNKSITKVVLSDTVEKICSGAFSECHNLTALIGGDGLAEIGDAAFFNAEISELYIPAGFKRFGTDSFTSDGFDIKYELYSDDFLKIENPPDALLFCGEKNRKISLEFRLQSPTRELLSVKLDGEEAIYTAEFGADGSVSRILIDSSDKDGLTGRTLTVFARAKEDVGIPVDSGEDFTLRAASAGKRFTSVIRDCTKTATADGRVFAWGNPSFPSAVFYSKRHGGGREGLYFGSLDYLEDGARDSRVLSVLPLSDGLAVFTDAGLGEPSIFFHKPTEKDGGGPLAYPITEIHTGDRAKGEAILFYDDPVFLTERGLCSLGQKSLSLQRSVLTRSSLVSAHLLSEDLSRASVAVWRGYLVVSVDGRMYLADSRQKFGTGEEFEYEWFLANGIGTYERDSRVYRYASVCHDGYILSDTPDAKVESTVYSEDTDGNGLVYFVREDDGKVEVYPTEEFYGGVFYPAEKIMADDSLLLFSTASGDVCLFNTDLRGVPPLRISEAEDFDAEKYARVMGNRIHSDFYDFASHAPRYALQTALDDCDIPHLLKSTSKKSLAIKLKTFEGSKIKCEVGCDLVGFSPVCEFNSSAGDFSAVDFSSLSFGRADFVTVLLNEGARGWIEKAIALYSEDFRSPFGIHSITYRYKIKGKIKYV